MRQPLIVNSLLTSALCGAGGASSWRSNSSMARRCCLVCRVRMVGSGRCQGAQRFLVHRFRGLGCPLCPRVWARIRPFCRIGRFSHQRPGLCSLRLLPALPRSGCRVHAHRSRAAVMAEELCRTTLLRGNGNVFKRIILRTLIRGPRKPQISL